MNANKLLLFITFLSLAIESLCQKTNNPIYEIEAEITDSCQVNGVLKLTLPSNLVASNDTLWFHLYQNAYSHINTKLVREEISRGFNDLYFDAQTNNLGYTNLEISINNEIQEVKYSKDKEYAFILNTQKSHSIKIRYAFNIRDELCVMNDVDHQLVLQNWFPKLAYCHNDNFILRRTRLGIPSLLNKFDLSGTLRLNQNYPVLDSRLVPQGLGNYYIELKNITDATLLAHAPSRLRKEHLRIDNSNLTIYHKGLLFEDISKINEFLSFLSSEYKLSVPEQLMIISQGEKRIYTSSPNYLRTAGQESFMSEFWTSILMDISENAVSEYISLPNEKDYWMISGLAKYIVYDYLERKEENRIRSDYFSKYFKEEDIPARRKRQFDTKIYSSYDNYCQCNSSMKGAIYYRFMEYDLGEEKFRQFIKNMVSPPFKVIDLKTLKKSFSNFSGTNSSWLFDSVILNETHPKLRWNSKNIRSNSAKIINHGDSEVPTKIRIYFDDYSHEDIEVKPFIGVKKIDLPKQKRIKSLYLDPENLMLDHNNYRNHIDSSGRVINEYSINMTPFKGDHSSKIFNIFPLLGFNNADGTTLGLLLNNSSKRPAKWNWRIATYYGIGSHRLVGEGRIGKFFQLKSSKVRSIEPALNIRSFHYKKTSFIEETDPLRFIRINPQISINFRHSTSKWKFSKLKFEYIHTRSELSQFDAGEYIGQSYENRNIYRTSYRSLFKSGVFSNQNRISLEYQSYDEDKSYLRISGYVKNEYYYKRNKRIGIRLWAGYFISNSQRLSSNYADFFTTGSLSLAQQGFNDYSYDEYFHTRQDQSSRFIQQVSEEVGGGFKTAIGNTSKLLMSNDFALSANLTADLPMRLPNFLDLNLFGDFGYYRVKSTENEELTGSFVYSLGITWHLFDGFEIHLPLINHEDINNKYDDLGRSLFDRFSFTLNLNQFNEWSEIDERHF